MFSWLGSYRLEYRVSRHPYDDRDDEDEVDEDVDKDD